MRHRKAKKVLDRSSASRRALLKSLVAHLIVHKRVKTTKAKAKVLQPQVEKLVTLAAHNSVHARRELLRKLGSGQDRVRAVRILLEELGPKYADRKGGYTRMVKLPARRGDSAEEAIIEFV